MHPEPVARAVSAIRTFTIVCCGKPLLCGVNVSVSCAEDQENVTGTDGTVEKAVSALAGSIGPLKRITTGEVVPTFCES